MQRSKSTQKCKGEEEETRQQQRMKAMTDMTRKISVKNRMDANNSWWVSELLAADCEEKAWLHPEWDDTMQRWICWLCEMKKKDEDNRKEEEHQQLASRMISSAEGLERRSTQSGVDRERFREGNEELQGNGRSGM